MFSTARLAACRIAVRKTAAPAASRVMILRMMTQKNPRSILLSAYSNSNTTQTFSSRHFSSAPPAFLDPAEVTDRIVAVVKNFDQVDPSKVTPTTKFAEDLGLDSLDIVEVVMAIEDEFAIEIPDQEADKILSIADAVEYISSHPMAK